MLNLGDIGHRVLHIGPKQTGKRRKTRPEKKHAREGEGSRKTEMRALLLLDKTNTEFLMVIKSADLLQ